MRLRSTALLPGLVALALAACTEVAVLTGFLSEDGNAYGLPVGVALDRHGALLVADDVGNVVWRVSTGR